MVFVSVCGLIDRSGSGFLSQEEPAWLARCLYFSFTTLITVGDDLTATSNPGHTLSVTETLAGQTYPRDDRRSQRFETGPQPR
jgi:hypothetical protein